MLIHKDALCVSAATVKEQARYFLAGAMFDAEGRAIATNGHTLVRYTSNPCPEDSFPKMEGLDVTTAEPVIVGADALEAAKTTMAKNSALVPLSYLALVPNGTHVTIGATNLNEEVRIRTRKVEGTFPDYKKVMDNAALKPVAGKVVLSVEELTVLVRAAKYAGARYIHFTFHGESPFADPIEFTAKAENGVIDGAIMPARG